MKEAGNPEWAARDEGQRGKMLHDIDLMDAMLYKNLQNLWAERSVSERRLIDLDSVLQTGGGSIRRSRA